MNIQTCVLKCEKNLQTCKDVFIMQTFELFDDMWFAWFVLRLNKR